MMFGAGAGRYSTHRWQLDSPFIREYSWPLLPSSVGFSFSFFFIRVIRVIRGPFFLLPLLDSKKHKIAQPSFDNNISQNPQTPAYLPPQG
jgi:hypothetical protein